MKGLSVRTKITLYFSAVLLVVVASTFLVILTVGSTVLRQVVGDNLIALVEDNLGEVEYVRTLPADADEHEQAIRYGDGWLVVDYDFLDEVNGVTAALYAGNGSLLYGSNPVGALPSAVALSDGQFQTVDSRGTTYFIYDRLLSVEVPGGLWLCGSVSVHQEDDKLTSVAGLSLVAMPLLLVLAVLGGYWIAGRTLRPIQTITAAAAEIGSGRDLKKRIALGAGRDELHRLADTFNAMFDRLDEAFEAERQFTSDASHELRTPVSVIRAQCEYTLERDRSPEEYREALEVISRQSRRMTRLVEDMLSFTRLERRAEGCAAEPVDLSALVRSACEDLALIREKSITLTCEAADGVVVEGDRALLGRLLTNLVGNAYRYGRENGYIRVKVERADGCVLLSVEDNGVGIAPEQQEKVFNRFYQADAARSGEGTGLGLAMAREIARLHGGDIRVTSEPGKGSIFVFRMPEKNSAL